MRSNASLSLVGNSFFGSKICPFTPFSMQSFVVRFGPLTQVVPPQARPRGWPATISTRGLGSTECLRKLAENMRALQRNARRFWHKLKQDPVSCLNLRFLEGKGIVADPIEFGGRIPAIIELTDSHFGEAAAGEWSPPEHQEGGTTIEPVVGCVMSPWGVMVAFRVAHRDVGSRLKLDWFKKSDPAASPIYLVDPVNHQYLYPIASSMKGDVLPGIPRTGIVVFQMPDSPTDRLQVHFSGVLVSRDRNKTSFSLEYTDQNLPHIIEHFKSLPTMSQQLTTMLDREFRNLRSELLK